jgi:hypothetical protein
VNLRRLLRADAIAWAAALVLLLFTAVDWYSTLEGEEARRLEGLSQPQGGAAGEVERQVREEARLAAEEQERNAWQADAAIDVLILAALLATAGLAVAAGVLRARGRRYEPPLTPSALTAGAAGLAMLLLIYRLIQQPGVDDVTTIGPGVPLALAALGVVALAAVIALRAEEAGRAWKELPSEPAEPDGSQSRAEPAEPESRAEPSERDSASMRDRSRSARGPAG